MADSCHTDIATPPVILVVDPLPAYRDGLAAALTNAGHAASSVDDVIDLQHLSGVTTALVTLPDGHPQPLSVARHYQPAATLVALLEDPTLDGYQAALAVGAAGAVPRHAPTGDIIHAVAHAQDGSSVVPSPIARALAAAAKPNAAPAITADERHLLRRLATGATIADIAEHAGYSERTMFRILDAIYRRLGAENRTAAIARAAELGVLKDAE